jgi:carbamoyl-phosphate synthase large subunit
MNLLFTSAGSRDYLIEYFAVALGPDDQVHIGNSDPLCSAFLAPGHRVVTPLIHAAGYIPFLLDYCEKHRIDGLIPLFDVDLPVLADARDSFAKVGTTVVVSEPEIARTCNDKWLTAQWLQRFGFSYPATFLTLATAQVAIECGALEFPVVVKPRWGMGAIGVMTAVNRDELPTIVQYVHRRVFESHLRFESAAAPRECIIIQAHAEGVEYHLDVLNDFHGRHAATVVKRKLATRSGETDAAVIEDVPALQALGSRLSTHLGHRGNLDVDVCFADGSASVLELNCRFGGGYPFAHLAGANFPAAVLAWLAGRQPRPEWLSAQPGTTGIKAIKPRRMISSSLA